MYAKYLPSIALLMAISSHAAPAYKCVDAGGAISFQNLPCPAQAKQTEVKVRQDPALPKRAATEPAELSPRDRAAAEAEGFRKLAETYPSLAPAKAQAATPAPVQRDASQISYECKSADGRLFYRHSPCPEEVEYGKSIAIYDPHAVGVTSFNPRQNYVPVTQREISRDEACRKIKVASSITREGHELDQRTSPYEKAVGRGACR